MTIDRVLLLLAYVAIIAIAIIYLGNTELVVDAQATGSCVGCILWLAIVALIAGAMVGIAVLAFRAFT